MRHKESPRAAKLLADALAAAKYDHIDQVAAQRAIEALREYIAQLEVNLFPHGLNDPQPVTCRGCELGWPLDGLAKARRIAAPSAKRSQAL